ncbi:MAG: hypothetical protein DID89_2727547567 [Candidatus Nitrotoga sp. CP45]|nr:MAG: hypothetical protein DID89_2727547567 [Candidatus Nitrotoga sp. CP45]
MSTFTTKDDTQIHNGGIGDSSQFYKDAGGHKNTFDCIKAFSETDFAEDLKQFDVPTLNIHGDDNQIVPIEGGQECDPENLPGRTPGPRGYAQRPSSMPTR